MKKLITLIIASILGFSGNLGLKETIASPNNEKENELVVLSTPDLYNLTSQLGKEYHKLNPGLIVKVVEVNNTEIPEIFNARSNIGFISTKYLNEQNSLALWQIVVGKEIIVPIINSNNPLLHEISEKGITRQVFAEILQNREKVHWGEIFKTDENQLVHFYAVKDAEINSVISKYLKIEQGKMQGQVLESKEALISAIQNDPYSLGFCKFTDIVNSIDYSLLSKIRIVAIDKNENGKIDYYEEIYDNFSAFTRGVWIGKYPKEMVSNIYTVASEKPTNDMEVSFLKWVITEGQQYLTQNGYSDLAFGEKQTKLNKLNKNVIYSESNQDHFASLKIILICLFGVILISLIIGSIIRMQHRKGELKSKSFVLSTFNINSVKIPEGLYFDKSHTWSFMQKRWICKSGY